MDNRSWFVAKENPFMPFCPNIRGTPFGQFIFVEGWPPYRPKWVIFTEQGKEFYYYNSGLMEGREGDTQLTKTATEL